MRFAWPANLSPDADGFHIEFPDVPGAHSWGGTEAAALEHGEEALVSILSSMISDGEQIPAGSAAQGRPEVILRPLDAAKVALHCAMLAKGVGSSELGRLLDMDEKAVRRLRDPLHGSKIEAIDSALLALGWRLDVSVVQVGERRPKHPAPRMPRRVASARSNKSPTEHAPAPRSGSSNRRVRKAVGE